MEEKRIITSKACVALKGCKQEKRGGSVIIGIGTDIVELERIEKALEGHAFAARIFCSDEQAYCEARGRQKTASYAARFAAKEAFVKALGTGFCGGTPADIEVRRSEGERPEIVLHGAYREAAEMKKVTFIHLSMSHCRQYAVAQVILEASE